MASNASASDVRNLIKSWVSWIAAELVWLSGVALSVILAVVIARDLGFDFPFVSIPGSAMTWVYAAGFYYLIRK